MTHEVCPGQSLRHSGVLYPSGALVPPGTNVEALEASGVIRPLGPSEPPPRPAPQPVASAVSSDEPEVFDPANPSSISVVPLRVLSETLADIDDEELLRRLHDADTRKGGRDRIEERLGELGVEHG